MTTSYTISSKIQRILTATGLLAISSLISRILGIIRDHIFANKFGALTGNGIFDIDTYYAAFRMPDLLFNLLIYGTISSAFIPIFVDYIKQNKHREGWEFTNAAFNLIFIIIFILSVITFIFAPWIVKLIVPGFGADKLELTVNLTRIMLLSPLFFTMSSFAQSVQNSFNYFVFYGLAPIFYNLGIIGGAILFADKYGVYGLTFGVIIGAAMHFFIQMPALYKLGYHYKFILDKKRKDVQQMIKLVLPRIIGLSANQITWVIYTIIASTLNVGTIAIFNYGINLQSLPMGIVGISFAISSFATLSAHANSKEKEKFTKTLSRNTKMILFLIIPSTIGMISLRFPITQLILGGGKFGTEDITLTANTIGLLAIGLLGNSLIPILGRAFYAWRNTKTPVIVGIASSIISIASALILTKHYTLGVYGLGIGFSLGALVNLIWLIVALKSKLDLHLPKDLYISFIKFTAASLIMLVFIERIKSWSETWQLAIQIGVTTLVGITIYFAACNMFNCEEIGELKTHIKNVLTTRDKTKSHESEKT